MKAHIVREPRCALLWNFPAGSPGYDAVERAARACRVALRPVDNGALGALVGDRPALIVSGLSHQNGELNRFLDMVSASGAALPLRAMVTPTSKGWTLAQLLLELNREHDAVGGGNP